MEFLVHSRQETVSPVRANLALAAGTCHIQENAAPRLLTVRRSATCHPTVFPGLRLLGTWGQKSNITPPSHHHPYQHHSYMPQYSWYQADANQGLVTKMMQDTASWNKKPPYATHNLEELELMKNSL